MTKIATFALLLGLTCAAAEPDGEPFSIMGVTLGFTLDQFKVVAVPENAGFASEDASRKRFRLPPLKRRFFPDCHQTGGLIKCQWMQADAATPPLSERPVQARTPFASGSGYFEFTFVRAEDGPQRLATIDVQSNMVQFEDLIAAYRARYGPPEETSIAVQNGFGATFDQQVFTWSNAIDKIEMRTFCGRVDYLCISYSRSSLEAQVEKTKKGNTAKAPSNF